MAGQGAYMKANGVIEQPASFLETLLRFLTHIGGEIVFNFRQIEGAISKSKLYRPTSVIPLNDGYNYPSFLARI